MNRKILNRPFKVKSVDPDGTFVGYASVFGELDSYRDIVLKGAFTNSLKEFEAEDRLVPMLWQHDQRNPIGVYTKLEEDDIGLLVHGQCNLKVQQGAECHALMVQRALTGLSIGYSTLRDEWDDKSSLRRLLEVKLWEISPVTFPAGDSARIVGVKTLEEISTLSDIEKVLRDAGFSKSETLTLVAKVKSIGTRSDSADGDISKALEHIRSINL